MIEGLRKGQLGASAEGTGDGLMTLHLTNKTGRKLRVVLPPGLVAAGATGLTGPNLDRSTLPLTTIVNRVSSGKNVMQAFAGTLTDVQIQQVALFVFVSRAG